MFFYILSVLLLSSCAALHKPCKPQFTHNEQSLPLEVHGVRVAVRDTTVACEQSGLAEALREWARKRFRPIAQTGTMELVVTTEPIAPCITGDGIDSRTVVVSVRIHGSALYDTVRLQVKAYRTNNKFGSEPPTPGTEVWSEYMSNLVNSLDAQIVHGLRHYAPKLLPSLKN